MNKKLKLWELNRLSHEQFAHKKKIPVIVVLDDIRSFENVGAIFRTADAFCIEQVFLCGITPVPPHREIHRTALGATESVSWQYFKTTHEAVDQLNELKFSVYAIEQAEKTTLLHNLNTIKFEKIALVFGNEVNGVNQEIINRCHGVIEIPQFGTKHSLNVSVCAGVILWECSRLLNPEMQDQRL